MKYAFLIVISTCALVGCGGTGRSAAEPPATPNSPPIVTAGVDQTVIESTTVVLNATAVDLDGDALTYAWTQTAGPNVSLSSTSVEDPRFEAPSVTTTETLSFQLSVSDGNDSAVTDSVTITVNDESLAPSTSWILGNNAKSVVFIDNGEFVDVDVLSVTTGTDTVEVTTNSVPSYTIEVTEAILAQYNAYMSGASANEGLSLGSIINFGENIGLSQTSCETGGNGWWPSGGGACLESLGGASYTFTTNPTEASTDCETGLSAIGLWVNGVYMFNWSDGQSYNNAGVWNKFAIPFRSKGMDICLGHGGGMSKTYHHHNYNECLRQELGDNGTGHSPVYGYAGDGYAVHGPYQAAGVTVRSCWVKRDYSASSSTGCGVDGARNCRYSDPTNPSDIPDVALFGTSVGPTTSDLVSVDYGEEVAASGHYKEDYIFDVSCPAQGEAYLDVHNGHTHGDLGYHYHTSVDENMFPTFPLSPGVTFRGNATGSFSCGGSGGAQ